MADTYFHVCRSVWGGVCTPIRWYIFINFTFLCAALIKLHRRKSTLCYAMHLNIILIVSPANSTRAAPWLIRWRQQISAVRRLKRHSTRELLMEQSICDTLPTIAQHRRTREHKHTHTFRECIWNQNKRTKMGWKKEKRIGICSLLVFVGINCECGAPCVSWYVHFALNFCISALVEPFKQTIPFIRSFVWHSAFKSGEWIVRFCLYVLESAPGGLRTANATANGCANVWRVSIMPTVDDVTYMQ